jgi:hypothetical protein
VTRVVVAGPLASKPRNGGGAWSRLSWVLGLRQLGCDAWFIEQIDRAHCSGEALETFDRAIEQLGLADRALLVDEDARALRGDADVAELCDGADLLVNHSGHLRRELAGRCRRRVYFDGDPGFTQIWHANENAGPRLEGHHLYYTVGTNVGRPGCSIPTGDIEWRPIRQPVPLDWWPVANGASRSFTTIGSWRGPYGPVEHEGRTYGLKVHEFRRFVELPQRTPQTFELALDIDPAEERDLVLLREHGWRLVDPRAVAGDPLAYRAYVQSSGAEFSVAQAVYVETASGWFSDRTARYLAAGKPVLVQDTGFGDDLPVGEGLVAFRTLADAVAGAEGIAADYERHARAARALAEERFDAVKVIRAVLEDAAP